MINNPSIIYNVFFSAFPQIYGGSVDIRIYRWVVVLKANIWIFWIGPLSLNLSNSSISVKLLLKEIGKLKRQNVCKICEYPAQFIQLAELRIQVFLRDPGLPEVSGPSLGL